MALRASGGAPCRGPAGPRGRVPVWPSSAARAGPRAAMRGIRGARALQGMRKKCRTAGPAGRPAPLRGRASRCPLGGFFARPAYGALSPSPLSVVLALGALGFTPSRACRAPEEAGVQGDCPPLGLCCGWVRPPLCFLPPCFLVALRFPVSPPLWWLSAPAPAWARPWAAPAALAGGEMVDRRCSGWGGTHGERKDRAREIPARLGPVPCATSFATVIGNSPFYWTFPIDFPVKPW